MRKFYVPWSNNQLVAWLWHSKDKTIISIPDLDFSCYSPDESQTAFMLFTNLVKYYNELKKKEIKLSAKKKDQLCLLQGWINSVEQKMMAQDNLVHFK